jgi:hypothetical protein
MLFDLGAQYARLRSMPPQFSPAVDCPGGCYACRHFGERVDVAVRCGLAESTCDHRLIAGARFGSASRAPTMTCRGPLLVRGRLLVTAATQSAASDAAASLIVLYDDVVLMASA